MRRSHLALTLLLTLASCRSALGIGDLETEDAPEAQGGASGTSGQASRAGRSGSGGGGSGRGGTAGMSTPGALKGGAGSSSGTSPGGAGAGTAAGAAGAGAGGSKAGTGGTAADAKACQSQCKATHPTEALNLFFNVLQDCACEVDELPSCEPACNACLVQGGEFEGQTAPCIACLAAKLEAKECKDSAKQCKGSCKEFAYCLDACEPP